MNARPIVGALVAALLGADVALAQDSPYTPVLDLRWIGSTLSDIEVDTDGNTVGQQLWFDQRVRGGVIANYGIWGWEAELDVMSGQLAGDTWNFGDLDLRRRDEHTAFSLAGFVPRKALVKGYVGNFELMGGLMTSHWGLGLLANDGAHDGLFGRTDLGDRVFRFRATYIPQHATPGRSSSMFSGAVDFVLDDGIATLARNELAFQVILAALQATAAGGRHGVYGVFRQQWDREVDRTMSVGVVDVYADHPVPVGEWTARLKGEALVIGGFTDRATTYNARQGVGVLQFGASAQASFTCPKELFTGHLLAGYGSGDGDPDDKWQTDYVFDPDHNVGLVLFDQVISGADAAVWAQLNDPANTAQAPDGADALVREGAARNVTYLQPVAQITALGGLDVHAGPLFAWSNAPYAQPFESFRNGGTPTNHLGVETPGRYLGTELDWSVGYGRDVHDGLTPSFTVQGGHLFVGPALQGPDGPVTIHHVMGVARLRW